MRGAPRLRVVLATVLAAWVAVGVAGPVRAAQATGPLVFDGPGQLFDPDEQLGPDERRRVEEALEELDRRHGVQLFVVVVDRLDGQGAQSWADRTAELNGLGLNDALLVVATGDRQYAWTVDGSFPLDDAQLETVAATRIEPELRRGDWAAAAVAAARGYDEQLAGTPTDGSANPGGRGWWWLAGLAVLALVAAVLLRLRARRAVPPEADADPLEAMPIEELATRLNARLVELDDALRTSRFDLDVAVREFGDDATRSFADALATAESTVADGWAAAGAAEPVDEPTRRARIRAALDALDQVDADLDAHGERFEHLRDRAGRAGELLDALATSEQQVRDRLPAAAARLEELRRRHPTAALATIDTNVEQATARVEFARDTIAGGREDLGRGDANAAALATSAAEEALSSAVLLLDGVDQLEAELAAALAALPGAESELRRDLTEADALAPTDPSGSLRGPSEAARSALAALEAARAEDALDPIAAVAALGAAGATLESSLAAHREQQAHLSRVRGLLGSTLPAARARVQGVSDYVTTRRGAIGAPARTSLAEARRLLEEAQALEPTDPERALELAQRAHAAADRAAEQARGDVDDYGRNPWGGGGGGNLSTMVLGGILLDSVLRGSRGGGYRGGGWSGGSGGGWSGGGGIGPGSFGGSGGRRGGGGRF